MNFSIVQLRWIAGAILICSATGCNYLGYAANAIGGSTTSAAKFTMPKRTTVVIAEKYFNSGESRPDEEPLARFIAEDLTAHNIAPVIDPGTIYAMQNDNPARWRGMTIAAAGRAAGGEQILYVNILRTNVEMTEGSNMLHGRGDVLVRLVDAQTGATMWPTDTAEGYPVSAETALKRGGQDGLNEQSVRTDVLRMLASRVGQLFYDVKSE